MATILLVEDAVELAQVIVRELKTAGFTVLHSPTGTAALEIFNKNEIDLIILDWMLPDIDGLDVLREIRRSSGVPILMLTARSEETDRVIGLEVGADDYLTKPFSMRELIARVRALLRRVIHIQKIMERDRAQSEQIVRYGPLTVNPVTYQAAMDGNPLDLTRTEFKLLHLLVRNPGRVFSRSYLLDAVWGEDSVVVDRVVDNAVLKLRKKHNFISDALQTVWGVGYRFSQNI